ncbi:hypothetical protein [Paenibacillus mucilaginosus]|uniref:Spore coat protein n=1 Tax=Paenibacillus mucilaginosus (strain KNP414) TaxID=1036673 RepID=F8FIY8_PAEMK|nr:hypothetical protein [Paenibacillus mucilaginosus]AEI46366.1 hypothetical protein KNP414_07881 [Paenibacillus mucilaginosus KNP414]MCG7213521.1 VCBS repeat-containing protein [Paenibacillus mucilaginosus]WDM27663.1 VCBS repeat-containing protein [Paenibacillus mucilaginosus]
MVWQYRSYQQPPSGSSRPVVLDVKQGDVTGDGIPDTVYLYGTKSQEPSGFADGITLVIQDGRTHYRTTVNLRNNAGYGARLFLGDFTGDRTADILVTIDSGGSGGYVYAYLYSFRNHRLRELFDAEKYSRSSKFKVNYENGYKVSVASPQLDVLFTLDISHKGAEYLSPYYREDGELKQPVQGEVLALGALYPMVTDPAGIRYDLMSLQRIIGTYNADTLGYVQNLLTWKGTAFHSSRLSVAIPPVKLISHY